MCTSRENKSMQYVMTLGEHFNASPNAPPPPWACEGASLEAPLEAEKWQLLMSSLFQIEDLNHLLEAAWTRTDRKSFEKEDNL